MRFCGAGRLIVWVVAGMLGLAADMPAIAQDIARTDVDTPPLDRTVTTAIVPQIDRLIDRLLIQRCDFTIDGVRVFDQDDKFLPGKIAAIMAYRVTSLTHDDPRLSQRLEEFSQLADMTLASANESWGIYYYLSALDSLSQAGLLDRALRPATLKTLRNRLDWRRFVRPDYTLIDLPNNYYGVAFAVSRLRYRLGWENATASDALLARTLSHYRIYSGQYGFADETDGEGRFDRYSVLLIAEIAQRLAETDTPIPPEIRHWLKGSAKLALLRMNARGEGWEYGRSIGAYGETALLEVLTVAARLKLLSRDEEAMAYAFCSRIAARYTNFWVDPKTGSVDLWGNGRKTDAYRGKHRIFGENLSLARQFFYTNAIWSDLGFGRVAPDAAFNQKLASLPQSTLTWFARSKYDRALLTLRDRGMLVSLPVINGAADLHRTNPYFPVPFSPGVLQGTAGATYPQLLPSVRLSDGTTLAPLAFFKGVQMARRGATTVMSWRQDEWDKVDGVEPMPDPRLKIRTRYTFSRGKIVREDTVTAAVNLDGATMRIEFAGFSSQPNRRAGVAFQFGHGVVTGFATRGYGDCGAMPVDSDYAATTGRMATVIRCQKKLRSSDRTFSLRWEMTYDPAGR